MIELWGQEDLPTDSGIPRFGCYFMDQLAIPQLVYQVRFLKDEILAILKSCRQIPRWDGKHMIVDYGPPNQYPYGKTFDVYLWDPGKVLDTACQWISTKIHGWQVRDQEGWYSWAPADKRFWSFIVAQIQRPKGYHYVLQDAARKLVYNPLPGIQVPYTGKWQGFAIGEVT